jgi:Beta protein
MSTLYAAMKLKPGEIQAMCQSERWVRDAVTPIFDVARPSSRTSIDERLEDSIELIHLGCQKISKEFYLDLRDLPLDCRLKNGAHPVYWLGQRLALHNHKVIHCFGFDRDSAYEEALTTLLTENISTNVALRLQQHDMKLAGHTEQVSLQFLAKTKREIKNTTVILDLQSIHSSLEDLGAMVERTYGRFQKLGASKFIFLASAMWDYTRIESKKINEVPRIDFKLWEQLRRMGLDIRYGDYGVIAPSFVDTERKFSGSPKFRYATPSMWLVAKGEKLKKGENSQYPRLAQGLIKSGHFRANDLSWGHEQLQAYANYEETVAGHSKAVAIDTCTHLNITTSQVLYVEREVARSLVTS